MAQCNKQKVTLLTWSFSVNWYWRSLIRQLGHHYFTYCFPSPPASIEAVHFCFNSTPLPYEKSTCHIISMANTCLLKKRCVQELQVTVTITAIKRSWYLVQLRMTIMQITMSSRWKVMVIIYCTDLHFAFQSWCFPNNTFNSNWLVFRPPF